MHELPPFETLYEVEMSDIIPLPPELARIYGRLQFPAHPGRPYIMGNEVTTLDGVVSLNVPGHEGGGDISGSNALDHVLMGIVRAIADVIIVGAGTLRASRDHRWTAEFIYPPLSAEYRQLRMALGKTQPPLNIIVTQQGNVDLTLPLFQSGEIPVYIVTTQQGKERLAQQHVPSSTQIIAAQPTGNLHTRAILEAIGQVQHSDFILTEGGPQLLSAFLDAQLLDEFFVTLAPQIAGRDMSVERPGLVAGKVFAPENPCWGRLLSVKRGGDHLFLRYGFTMIG